MIQWAASVLGFGYHFDPSDAVILQVQGNKQGPRQEAGNYNHFGSILGPFWTISEPLIRVNVMDSRARFGMDIGLFMGLPLWALLRS